MKLGGFVEKVIQIVQITLIFKQFAIKITIRNEQ